MQQTTSFSGLNRRLIQAVFCACLLPLTAVASSSHVLANETVNANLPEPGPDESIVSGIVLDSDERPVADSRVTLHIVPEPIVVRSDKAGRFQVIAPTMRCRGMKLTAAHEQQLAFAELPWEEVAPEQLSSVLLQLKDERIIDIQVSDAQGQPVEQAKIGAVSHYAQIASGMTNDEGTLNLAFPADAELNSVFAFHRDLGLDYETWRAARTDAENAPAPAPPVESVSLKFSETRTIRIEARDLSGKPIPHMTIYPWYFQKPGQTGSLNLFINDFCIATNDQGIAVFNWIPLWNVEGLTFWPWHDDYDRCRVTFEPEKLDDPDERNSTIVLTTGRNVPLSGVIRFSDGKPGAGIRIRVAGDAFHWDSFRGETTTNENGEYDLSVAPNQIYSLVVDDTDWASVMRSGIVVRPNTPVTNVDFELQRAVRVAGRLIHRKTRKPVASQRFRLQQVADNKPVSNAELGLDTDRRFINAPDITRNTTSDDEGQFEFRVGPGKYSVYGPTQVGVKKLEILPGSDDISLEFTTARPERGQLRGFVITDSPPKPVPEAVITGVSCNPRNNRGDFRAVASENGHFQGERSLHDMVLHARSKDGTLAGLVEITADHERAVIKLRPTVTIKGRLIDQSGKGIADHGISAGRKVHLGGPKAPWQTRFGAKTITDKTGRFALSGLVAKEKYFVSIPLSESSSQSLASPLLDKPAIDVGNLVIEQAP